MSDKKTLGQIAYEAYCQCTGWKSLITGAPLPQYTDLKPEIIQAWEASSVAVRISVHDEVNELYDCHRKGANVLTESQISKMADRFCGMPLPPDFHPDGGITFEKMAEHHYAHGMPSGTNLLTHEQAKEMIRYMIEGLDG